LKNLANVRFLATFPPTGKTAMRWDILFSNEKACIRDQRCCGCWTDKDGQHIKNDYSIWIEPGECHLVQTVAANIKEYQRINTVFSTLGGTGSVISKAVLPWLK
jgi:hypothetical protein